MSAFSNYNNNLIQSTVELNDELTQISYQFMKKYNKVATKINNIINKTSNNIQTSNLLPFLGSKKKLITSSELEKSLSFEYIMIHKDTKTKNPDHKLDIKDKDLSKYTEDDDYELI